MRYLIILFLLLSINTYAQKEDYIWPLGSNGGGTKAQLLLDTTKRFWPFNLNFNNDPMTLEYRIDRKMNARNTISSISYQDGELFAYSHGRAVWDGNDDFIASGDTINYDEAWEFWNLSPNTNFGFKTPQGMIMLPYPDRDSLVFWIVSQSNFDRNTSEGFYWGTIAGYDGQSPTKVVEKDNFVQTGDLKFGMVKANRHANGRDWWLLMISDDNTTIYTYLLDPDGLSLIDRQNRGRLNTGFTSGNAVFSADGSKYAVIDGGYYTLRGWISVFDFNRCTGRLSNAHHKFIRINQYSIGQSVVFSPNGKYLYANTDSILYQIDLSSSDYPMTELATYDGFQSFPDPSGLNQTVFGYWAEGPDGRHYNVSGAGTALHMHIMDYPNEGGEAASFRQHALRTPNNPWSIPNFPNYRLGPLDGSTCDTLGLDNHPIAKYRYESADTIDFRHIRFTDLSYFRPTRWVWDFGDGMGQLEAQSPYHRYVRNGTYNVCLTVSNEYSSNTTCRLITLGMTTTTQDTRPTADISIFPNPATDYFNLTLGDYVPARGTFTLYALSGVVVHTQRVYYGQNAVDVTDLPTGMYVYRLTDEGQVIGEGKVVLR